MSGMKQFSKAKAQLTARKTVRTGPSDRQRIQGAASAIGLSKMDFIVQASVQKANLVERNLGTSVLPEDAFEKFKQAVTAPGKRVSGLALAALQSDGILLDV